MRHIFSYWIFAFKVFIRLRRSHTDIIYVNFPPNVLSLAVFLACPREVKVVADILDLWSESFPHNRNRLI
jgi:hypothetical protein